MQQEEALIDKIDKCRHLKINRNLNQLRYYLHQARIEVVKHCIQSTMSTMVTSDPSTTTFKASSDLLELQTTVKSTLALLATFQLSLSSKTPSSPGILNPPNPLRLLSDSCSLLKAQTTKLSLLILNKPFTPTAINFILKNLSSECLPALMTALELCTPQQYTKFLKDHVRANLSRIMRELTSLLGIIPTNEKALTWSTGTEKDGDGRDTLSSTGVIWEVCDAIIDLASKGLVELATKKADAYHALIKDAIAELEEWNPDEEEEDPFGSDNSTDSENEEKDEKQKMPASLPTAAMNTLTLTPPATPTPLRQTYEQSLATMRLIRLLYPALRKRRILAFPPLTSSTSSDQLAPFGQIQKFDDLMGYLRTFSELADELAGALYSQDEDEAFESLGTVKMHAKRCLEDFDLNWAQKEDEFTEWSKKWTQRLRELSPRPNSGSANGAASIPL